MKKHTEFREHEFQRRIRTTAFSFPTWMVSIEDLIISKIIWIQEYQSDRQMDDIKNLLLNESADRNYIKSWCEKLDLETYKLI